jgi:hypothetical protein
MNLAILIYPQSWFHCVLGFIDAMPTDTRIDAYVCNEHDWVGLLKQSYQNGIRNQIRENFQIFNIDNFHVDNQYDYVIFPNKENMLKNDKSVYLRDWLPMPITHKLFPNALPKLQGKIIGVVGSLTEPLKIVDNMIFVFINFTGSSNHFPGDHFHLEGDAFYIQVALCDYLFPTDLSDELSIVCKVPLLFSSKKESKLLLPSIVNKPRRFEMVHLVNDDPLNVFVRFDKALKRWQELEYTVKIWSFDDLLQFAQNHSITPHENSWKQWIVFYETGIAPNPNFVPLKHDGYWNIIGDEIISNAIIGSTIKQNPKIWNEPTDFNPMSGYQDTITDVPAQEFTEVSNQYEPWAIATSCVFIFLLFCFFLRLFFLRKKLHFLQDASSSKMFMHKGYWK